MFLKHLRILLLYSAGLAFLGLNSGIIQQAHIAAAEPTHCHCSHEGSQEGQHSEDHDEDTCELCQQFATVTKQLQCKCIPYLFLSLDRSLIQIIDPKLFFTRLEYTTSPPRAPPFVELRSI